MHERRKKRKDREKGKKSMQATKFKKFILAATKQTSEKVKNK